MVAISEGSGITSFDGDRHGRPPGAGRGGPAWVGRVPGPDDPRGRGGAPGRKTCSRSGMLPWQGEAASRKSCSPTGSGERGHRVPRFRRMLPGWRLLRPSGSVSGHSPDPGRPQQRSEGRLPDRGRGGRSRRDCAGVPAASAGPARAEPGRRAAEHGRARARGERGAGPVRDPGAGGRGDGGGAAR